MKQYLKKLTDHNAYTVFLGSSDYITPNVSLCVTENGMYYNPYVETRVILKFNITNTGSLTQLCDSSNVNQFSEVEIDGVIQSSIISKYVFTTTGEHIVKYTLKNQTSIGSYTFQNCTNLTSVIIPSCVTSIGNYAFQKCSGLTSVTIPNGVISIGDNTFYNCTSLTSITLPDSVTSIGTSFQGCSGLTSINIPSGVTSIGNSAFRDTPWWNTYSTDTSHHYGNIIYINDIAYKSVNSSITSITFRNNTRSISDYAFSYCTKLTSVTIPNSVTSIGNSVFSGCSGLTSVTIPSGVTSIGERIFQYCDKLTSIDIPSSVTSIGDSAFNYCSSLTSIVCNAITAPTIQSSTFTNVKTGGTLTVPSGSTGYDVWMGTGNYYLGKYNWTKVEQ